VDAYNYDFHERKSKEIRRLQFTAEWNDRLEARRRRRNARKNRKPVVVPTEESVEIEIEVEEEEQEPPFDPFAEKRRRFMELIEALARSGLSRAERI